MVHARQVVGEYGAERVRVACGDRGLQARGIGGRGVRSHPPLALRCGSGWNGRESRLCWLGRELVEAGERLIVVVGIEQLVAGYEAVASKNEEHEELPLEGTAASACRAEVRPARQQRVRP